MNGGASADRRATDLERLITGLLDPVAYPGRTAAVRLVQTHASCVFLAGDYAYKVKKPVDFDFLDYTTLEKRQACCEREVYLNRRLCPEVYLDVVPIVVRDGRLVVDGEGEPVEWAVRMRQLPEGDMLPARLAAGLVSTADIRKIGSILAAFHAGAAAGPELRPFGSPEAVGRNVEENFRQVEPLVGELLTPDHLESVRRYARAFLRDQAARFRQRMDEDRIRDGHGDLRAQNICLFSGLQDGVQIFDCIEFNDRFRYEDVAADLAYLAMDLDLAGWASLRRVLVEAYREAPGDAGPADLLRFYQCYRAWVRGKIALLAAREIEIPDPERREHQRLAAAAFDLACSYALCRDRPSLVITVGLSGSGKSVVARALARRLPAVRIASDDLRKERAAVPKSERLPHAAYTGERRAAVYGELFQRAEKMLAAGEHALLDATFLSAADRDAAAAVAGRREADLWIVECRCPEDVARRRIAARRNGGSDASDASIAVYEDQRRRFEPVIHPWLTRERHVVLETGRPPEQLARQFLSRFWASAGSDEQTP
jgi:uncharacterized protein